MLKCIKKVTSINCLALLMFIMIMNSTLVYATGEGVTASTVLDEGRELIVNYYIESVPDSALREDNLRDMVKELKDPYSAYLSSKEYDEFISMVDNKFSGIGVHIEIVSEGVKVLSVIEKSSAKEAEMVAGDIIIEADGHSLKGLSTEQAVRYIRGEEGTIVVLKIIREQAIIEKKVERRKVVLPTVEVGILHNRIGYIGIATFGEATPGEFRGAIEFLNKEKVDSYIIDLRYNIGGFLDSAFKVGGYFIGGNPSLEVRKKSGEIEILNAFPQDIIIDKPVIFLVNRFSASASEILTAAVKDYKKAFIIGEQTFGKGVGQSLFQLSDGSVLKLSTFKFYSPKGDEINNVGVSPDLHIKSEKYQDEIAFQLAQLLLSGNAMNGGAVDSIKIKLVDNIFDMSSNSLRDPVYKEAADYLMNNVFQEDSSFIWRDNQWIKASVINEDKAQDIEDKKKNIEDNKQNIEDNKVVSDDTKKDNEELVTPEVLPKTGVRIDLEMLLLFGFGTFIMGLRLVRCRQ